MTKYKNEAEVRSAIEASDPQAVLDATSEIRKNASLMSGLIAEHGVSVLRYVSDTLQDDSDFMLSEAQKNLDALQYTGLVSNSDFMLRVVKEGMVEALSHADDKLKQDRDFMLKAISVNAQAFLYTPLKDNNDFIEAAIQENGLVLAHLPEALKSNRALVLTAVRQNGDALQYASETLQNDWRLRAATMVPLLAAAMQNPKLSSTALALLIAAAITAAIVMSGGLALVPGILVGLGSGIVSGVSFFCGVNHPENTTKVAVDTSEAPVEVPVEVPVKDIINGLPPLPPKAADDVAGAADADDKPTPLSAEEIAELNALFFTA